ncbi:hypothetical protein BCV72DRAFT_247996 [Rhizopus microsporus var. microsporus]|uniref:Uncharacterized protein n=1 Tax=Rhizopus microsporus var. microsporus TaxID=86635 RepID=A0A1X0RC80_RHIZD|nr:hypothetical protein BCV72DRAFT_247996 [Rhizopus microsporus var. microsporus]
MSFQIFYEDELNNAIDEYGRPEPMDYIIDEERYALETVSSHTQYLHNQPQENNFELFPSKNEDAKDDVDVCVKEALNKVRFFKLMFEKVMSALAAVKQLCIHVRTTQRWAQMCKADPDSNLSVVLEQVMQQLLQKFQDLKISKSTVYNFVRTECNLSLKKAQLQPCTDMGFRINCIFLDESAFHINSKRSMAGSKKDCLLWSQCPKPEYKQ